MIISMYFSSYCSKFFSVFSNSPLVENKGSCIILTLMFICIPIFMKLSRVLFELLQDPVFEDGWTDGQMEGKLIFPSGDTPPVGG